LHVHYQTVFLVIDESHMQTSSVISKKMQFYL